jgi:hypothetical protein
LLFVSGGGELGLGAVALDLLRLLGTELVEPAHSLHVEGVLGLADDEHVCVAGFEALAPHLGRRIAEPAEETGTLRVEPRLADALDDRALEQRRADSLEVGFMKQRLREHDLCRHAVAADLEAVHQVAVEVGGDVHFKDLPVVIY